MVTSAQRFAIPLSGGEPASIDLSIIAANISGCPASFRIARPANPASAPRWTRAFVAAAGRGFTPQEAETGVIFEAIERASALADGPEDPRRHIAADPARNANDYWQFSAAQLRHLSERAATDLAEFSSVAATDLVSGQAIMVPASAIFVDEDIRLGWPPIVGTSSGTAARPAFADAARAALLERIERDAVAIWWYNRLPAPVLDPQDVADALPPAFAAWITGRRRTTTLIMTPTDLPVPAVVALTATSAGDAPAIGAAAALDPCQAVRAAILEALQCEIALAHMRLAQECADPPPVPPLLAWSRTTRLHDDAHLAGAGTVRLPAPTAEAGLLAGLARAGVDVAIADITRPEIGIPVAKAVSRTLRDWQPRFAPGRLADVPVNLGLCDRPAREDEMNPVPFVI